VVYSPRPADILFCLEIPFTSHGRLAAWLRRAMPQRRFGAWPDDGLGPEDLPGRILAGECGYRVYHTLPRKPVYLTALADPLRRLAAAYAAVRSDPVHPLYDASPGEFLRSEFACEWIHDRQVRQLVDSPDADLPPTVQLEIAGVRLDEFAFFALADRWAESAILFGRTFGVEPPAVDNDPPWSAQASAWQGLEDEIRQLNPLDTALLEVARRVFEARLAGGAAEAHAALVGPASDAVVRPVSPPARGASPTSLGRSTLRVPLHEDDLLLFVHVPKTGGLSLISLLDDRYPFRRILPLHSVVHPSVVDTFPQEQFDRFRLARGHFLFGPYDGSLYRRLAQNPVLATMLREPVARSLSSLLHTLRRPELAVRIKHIQVRESRPGAQSRLPRLKAGEVWSALGSLLDNPRHAHHLRNRQTQFVVGAVRPLSPELGTITDLSDQAMLELALERLEQMAFVGLTERYPESLLLMAHTFGWPAPSFMPRLNVSQPLDEAGPMPDDLRARLEELTQIDRRLYDWARELFEARWAALLREVGPGEAPVPALSLRTPATMRLQRALWGMLHVLQQFRIRWLTRGSLLDRALQWVTGRWLMV